MVAVGLVCFCVVAQAQRKTVLQVLILNSYDESTAPYLTPKNVFMLELQNQYASPIAFRQFDLEARSGNESSRRELKAELSQNEYGESPHWHEIFERRRWYAWIAHSGQGCHRLQRV